MPFRGASNIFQLPPHNWWPRGKREGEGEDLLASALRKKISLVIVEVFFFFSLLCLGDYLGYNNILFAWIKMSFLPARYKCHKSFHRRIHMKKWHLYTFLSKCLFTISERCYHFFSILEWFRHFSSWAWLGFPLAFAGKLSLPPLLQLLDSFLLLRVFLLLDLFS